MIKTAIIGGTGLLELDGFAESDRQVIPTPFGEPSATLVSGRFVGVNICFLARHGNPHTIPPHRVNYRANCWALKEAGVETVFAVNAVGGITAEMRSGRLVIPDQIIDYTWSRNHTFFDRDLERVTHVDFTHPYDDDLRRLLLESARHSGVDLHAGGTYGATQGPRLESAAEINRMERDGCDIVGMTGMPEAALARELELAYVSICMVVNRAAGRAQGPITEAMIAENLTITTSAVVKLLQTALPHL